MELQEVYMEGRLGDGHQGSQARGPSGVTGATRSRTQIAAGLLRPPILRAMASDRSWNSMARTVLRGALGADGRAGIAPRYGATACAIRGPQTTDTALRAGRQW
jgi:hypothetical protein